MLVQKRSRHRIDIVLSSIMCVSPRETEVLGVMLVLLLAFKIIAKKMTFCVQLRLTRMSGSLAHRRDSMMELLTGYDMKATHAGARRHSIKPKSRRLSTKINCQPKNKNERDQESG